MGGDFASKDKGALSYDSSCALRFEIDREGVGWKFGRLPDVAHNELW